MHLLETWRKVGSGWGQELCFGHIRFQVFLRSPRREAKRAAGCANSQKRCGHHWHRHTVGINAPQWASIPGRNAVTERQTWQKEGRGSSRGPWGASPVRAWVEKEEPAKKTGEEGAVREGRAGREGSRSRWTGCWRKAQPGEGGPRMHSLCLLVWQVLSSAPPPSLILSTRKALNDSFF